MVFTTAIQNRRFNMAYESNDTQEFVGSVKLGNCSELRVSKITDENDEF